MKTETVAPSRGGRTRSLPPLRAFRAWRQRRRSSPLWTLIVAVALALTMIPVVSIAWLALSGQDNNWRHLASTVLPSAIATTLWLLIGTGLVAGVVGTMAAWLVTQYRFPGRDLAAWLLLLPLAIPTYIVAYSYGELMDYAGPLQTGLRSLLGFEDQRAYWFPEIRSLPGAMLVLAAVLYPYVYLSMRASFLQQSVGTLEVARTLGSTVTGAFFRVALPLARPALAGGIALVLMETLNDLGATEYFGVRTLTVTAYQTWLQRSSLAGAAEIASITLLFVVMAYACEHWLRGNAAYHDPVAQWRAVPEVEVPGVAGWLLLLLVLAPVLLGFALPMAMLLSSAWTYLGEVAALAFWQAAFNSLVLAALAASGATVIALILAYARRVAPNGFTRPAVRLTGFGYALPGTILALGLLIPLARFDNWLDGLMREGFGYSTGLLLTGSITAVLMAYVIRFMAVALSATESGLSRLSPNLDAAARTLGETAWTALRRVHYPLLRPAIGTALLLVFVDVMKELPATLLLRPFDFETLATRVYGFAAIEAFEEAAFGALTIVLIGLVPVILLNWTIVGGHRNVKRVVRP
ncbi:MAG: iron ABC transporter permease [Hyphomicrobiaceae bacterium]